MYLQNEDDALQNLEDKSVIQLKEIDPFVQKVPYIARVTKMFILYNIQMD